MGCPKRWYIPCTLLVSAIYRERLFYNFWLNLRTQSEWSCRMRGLFSSLFWIVTLPLAQLSISAVPGQEPPPRPAAQPATKPHEKIQEPAQDQARPGVNGNALKEAMRKRDASGACPNRPPYDSPAAAPSYLRIDSLIYGSDPKSPTLTLYRPTSKEGTSRETIQKWAQWVRHRFCYRSTDSSWLDKFDQAVKDDFEFAASKYNYKNNDKQRADTALWLKHYLISKIKSQRESAAIKVGSFYQQWDECFLATLYHVASQKDDQKVPTAEETRARQDVERILASFLALDPIPVSSVDAPEKPLPPIPRTPTLTRFDDWQVNGRDVTPLESSFVGEQYLEMEPRKWAWFPEYFQHLEKQFYNHLNPPTEQLIGWRHLARYLPADSPLRFGLALLRLPPELRQVANTCHNDFNQTACKRLAAEAEQMTEAQCFELWSKSYADEFAKLSREERSFWRGAIQTIKKANTNLENAQNAQKDKEHAAELAQKNAINAVNQAVGALLKSKTADEEQKAISLLSAIRNALSTIALPSGEAEKPSIQPLTAQQLHKLYREVMTLRKKLLSRATDDPNAESAIRESSPKALQTVEAIDWAKRQEAVLTLLREQTAQLSDNTKTALGQEERQFWQTALETPQNPFWTSLTDPQIPVPKGLPQSAVEFRGKIQRLLHIPDHSDLNKLNSNARLRLGHILEALIQASQKPQTKAIKAGTTAAEPLRQSLQQIEADLNSACVPKKNAPALKGVLYPYLLTDMWGCLVDTATTHPSATLRLLDISSHEPIVLSKYLTETFKKPSLQLRLPWTVIERLHTLSEGLSAEVTDCLRKRVLPPLDQQQQRQWRAIQKKLQSGTIDKVIQAAIMSGAFERYALGQDKEYVSIAETDRNRIQIKGREELDNYIKSATKTDKNHSFNNDPIARRLLLFSHSNENKNQSTIPENACGYAIAGLDAMQQLRDAKARLQEARALFAAPGNIVPKLADSNTDDQSAMTEARKLLSAVRKTLHLRPPQNLTPKILEKGKTLDDDQALRQVLQFRRAILSAQNEAEYKNALTQAGPYIAALEGLDWNYRDGYAQELIRKARLRADSLPTEDSDYPFWKAIFSDGNHAYWGSMTNPDVAAPKQIPPQAVKLQSQLQQLLHIPTHENLSKMAEPARKELKNIIDSTAKRETACQQLPAGLSLDRLKEIYTKYNAAKNQVSVCVSEFYKNKYYPQLFPLVAQAGANAQVLTAISQRTGMLESQVNEIEKKQEQASKEADKESLQKRKYAHEQSLKQAREQEARLGNELLFLSQQNLNQSLKDLTTEVNDQKAACILKAGMGISKPGKTPNGPKQIEELTFSQFAFNSFPEIFAQGKRLSDKSNDPVVSAITSYFLLRARILVVAANGGYVSSAAQPEAVTEGVLNFLASKGITADRWCSTSYHSLEDAYSEDWKKFRSLQQAAVQLANKYQIHYNPSQQNLDFSKATLDNKVSWKTLVKDLQAWDTANESLIGERDLLNQLAEASGPGQLAPFLSQIPTQERRAADRLKGELIQNFLGVGGIRLVEPDILSKEPGALIGNGTCKPELEQNYQSLLRQDMFSWNPQVAVHIGLKGTHKESLSDFLNEATWDIDFVSLEDAQRAAQELNDSLRSEKKGFGSAETLQQDIRSDRDRLWSWNGWRRWKTDETMDSERQLDTAEKSWRLEVKTLNRYLNIPMSNHDSAQKSASIARIQMDDQLSGNLDTLSESIYADQHERREKYITLAALTALSAATAGLPLIAEAGMAARAGSMLRTAATVARPLSTALRPIALVNGPLSRGVSTAWTFEGAGAGMDALAHTGWVDPGKLSSGGAKGVLTNIALFGFAIPTMEGALTRIIPVPQFFAHTGKNPFRRSAGWLYSRMPRFLANTGSSLGIHYPMALLSGHNNAEAFQDSLFEAAKFGGFAFLPGNVPFFGTPSSFVGNAGRRVANGLIHSGGFALYDAGLAVIEWNHKMKAPGALDQWNEELRNGGTQFLLRYYIRNSSPGFWGLSFVGALRDHHAPSEWLKNDLISVAKGTKKPVDFEKTVLDNMQKALTAAFQKQGKSAKEAAQEASQILNKDKEAALNAGLLRAVGMMNYIELRRMFGNKDATPGAYSDDLRDPIRARLASMLGLSVSELASAVDRHMRSGKLVWMGGKAIEPITDSAKLDQLKQSVAQGQAWDLALSDGEARKAELRRLEDLTLRGKTEIAEPPTDPESLAYQRQTYASTVALRLLKAASYNDIMDLLGPDAPQNEGTNSLRSLVSGEFQISETALVERLRQSRDNTRDVLRTQKGQHLFEEVKKQEMDFLAPWIARVRNPRSTTEKQREALAFLKNRYPQRWFYLLTPREIVALQQQGTPILKEVLEEIVKPFSEDPEQLNKAVSYLENELRDIKRDTERLKDWSTFTMLLLNKLGENGAQNQHGPSLSAGDAALLPKNSVQLIADDINPRTGHDEQAKREEKNRLLNQHGINNDELIKDSFRGLWFGALAFLDAYMSAAEPEMANAEIVLPKAHGDGAHGEKMAPFKPRVQVLYAAKAFFTYANTKKHKKVAEIGFGVPGLLTSLALAYDDLKLTGVDTTAMPETLTRPLREKYNVNLLQGDLVTTEATRAEFKRNGPYGTILAQDTFLKSFSYGKSAVEYLKLLHENLEVGGRIIIINDMKRPTFFTQEEARQAGFSVSVWNDESLRVPEPVRKALEKAQPNAKHCGEFSVTVIEK